MISREKIQGFEFMSLEKEYTYIYIDFLEFSKIFYLIKYETKPLIFETSYLDQF